MNREQNQKYAFVLSSLVLSALVASRHLIQSYPASRLINPNIVAPYALSMPEDEDSFILAAWQEVSDGVQYEGYGTELYLLKDSVKCDKCLLPEFMLQQEHPNGNCVAKSFMLASLLRNRLPPDRVYVALGDVRGEGHAWVIAQRSDGQWYNIETTVAFTGEWVPLSEATDYHPEALMNDKTHVCYSPEFCLTVKEASCGCMEHVR